MSPPRQGESAKRHPFVNISKIPLHFASQGGLRRGAKGRSLILFDITNSCNILHHMIYNGV